MINETARKSPRPQLEIAQITLAGARLSREYEVHRRRDASAISRFSNLFIELSSSLSDLGFDFA